MPIYLDTVNKLTKYTEKLMSTDLYYNFIFITQYVGCFCVYRELEREGYAVWLRDNFMTESCLNAMQLSCRKRADKLKSLKYAFI